MVVMYCDKLTGEDVNIPSLEAFKPGLEGALATQRIGKCPSPWQEEVELDDL